MKKKLYQTAIVSFILLLVCISVLLSNRTGRAGCTIPTSAGCSGSTCHGSLSPNIYNTTLSVTSGTGSFIVLPGSVTNFTIQLNNSAMLQAGINISVKDGSGVNAGTLTNIQNDLSVSNSELTHSVPALLTNNRVTFMFTWTAPLTEGTYTMYAAGCATLIGSQPLPTDEWNFMTPVDIKVSTGEPVFSSLGDIDFGEVHYGRQRDTVIKIMNPGNKQLIVTGIEILGTNAADYTFPDGAPLFNIDQGGSHLIKVRFLPVGLSGDPKTAYINFTNNSQTNPKVINLTGTSQTAIRAYIATTPASLDFGSVKITQFSEKQITIKNTGDKVLQVTSANLSGNNKKDFTFSSPTTFSLEPDSSAKFTVRFTPTGLDERDAEFNFTSNSFNDVIVKLTGTGLPGPKATLTASLTNIFFGAVPVTKTKDTTIIVKNIGDSLLEVTNVLLEGQNVDDFSILSGGGSFFLQKNQVRNMVVRFAPKTASVSKSARIKFVSNDTASPLILLNGSAPVAPYPNMLVYESEIDFGDLKVNLSKDTTFTVKNIGNADLQISSIDIVTPGTVDFVLPNKPINITITAGDSIKVPVSFTPKSSGQKQALLEIYSNAGDAFQMALMGNALPASSVEDYENKNEFINLYPNPATTEIEFKITYNVFPVSRFSIFNSSGILVKELNTTEPTVKWNLLDENGNLCSDGIYNIVISSGNKINKEKFLIIR